MLKITEIRAMNDSDLVERLDSSKQELMKLREKYATRQLEDSSQMRQVRRDVARLRTEQRARQLAQQQKGNS
jgi:large subunit ribosomal protein L29